jgi:hypothetical protein
MNDPEVQNILRDPVMQQVLKDFQENPKAAQVSDLPGVTWKCDPQV